MGRRQAARAKGEATAQGDHPERRSLANKASEALASPHGGRAYSIGKGCQAHGVRAMA